VCFNLVKFCWWYLHCLTELCVCGTDLILHCQKPVNCMFTDLALPWGIPLSI